MTDRHVSVTHFYSALGILVTTFLTIGGTTIALLVNGIDRGKESMRSYVDMSNRQLERQIDDNSDRMNSWVEGGFLPNMEGTEDGDRNESP